MASHQNRSVWLVTDLTFATTELSREFPALRIGWITDAVEIVAANVPSADGRVILVARAREHLRAAFP